MEMLKMSEDKKSASCNQCRCKEGKVVGCHHIFKCTLDDPKCERYEERSDQCCPACGMSVLVYSGEGGRGGGGGGGAGGRGRGSKEGRKSTAGKKLNGKGDSQGGGNQKK